MASTAIRRRGRNQKYMKNNKYVYSLLVLIALATLIGAVPALADNNNTNNTSAGQPGIGRNGAGRGMMNRGNIGNIMMKPGVFGTVSAVNGNTITVTGKQGFGANAVATTFTVDATNAKVIKNNVAGTVSSILVGDTIVAQGTLTGTNLVATNIRDGVVVGRGLPNTNKMMNKQPEQALSLITGNGQPVVVGTVSSIVGPTVVITNKSNVSYTIDATNAKITQGPNTISISNLAVGDMLVVQGTVNGNAVVASTIIDQAKPVSTTATPVANGESHGGFFAGVGSFFAHLFGY